ncbi:hypothetical protein [Corynebacterium suedekumii]|uniref:Restriction endonuclease n=1 Tax=Corynebacterium suedekumii TaxID=3049801 RepID=A0ABY8VPJ6_9CORY|nr:hypothetical protein [Corynebacterium suedekumii]WIM71581.1 hypothetical protein QP029_04090 [Corynebacterium suedekumii]
MAAESSAKDKAWILFDEIVKQAAPGGEHSHPWATNDDGSLRYEPDFDTLTHLLGVPLQLKATSQSGVPALALDVWLSYELRRAGFHSDHTWPRAEHPRILPMSISHLLAALPRAERASLQERLASKSSIRGVTAASANILGKNYLKQVDVIMTDWATGPELLISTKRMDSSYGKNAANRIEESYGDVKNLRMRHPQAALGFVYGLRSDILTKEPDTAEWLIDLLGKLGNEEDAYHATCLIMFDYDDLIQDSDEEESEISTLAEPGVDGAENNSDTPVSTPQDDVATSPANFPRVDLLHREVPRALSAGRFLSIMVNRVLDATPITMHKEARNRRRAAAPNPTAVGEIGSTHNSIVVD